MSMTPLRHRCVRIVAGLVVALTSLATVVVAPAPAAASDQSSLEAELLNQMNAERQARGLPAFRVDTNLVAASRVWSGSMSSRTNLVHSSDGRAEIIARGYRTGQITEAWMRSSGHRNLMVDPNLAVAGVGVTCDANGQMWATVQFTRADTSLGTQKSSAATPRVTPSDAGSSCSSAKAAVSSGSVQRLYLAYFRRSSDRAGLDYWVGRLDTGARLETVSDAFAASSEFQQRYGSLSNRDFVKLVYVNVMGREPDAAGYDYWVGQLQRGTARGSVMIGFSESTEFRLKTGIN